MWPRSPWRSTQASCRGRREMCSSARVASSGASALVLGGRRPEASAGRRVWAQIGHKVVSCTGAHLSEAADKQGLSAGLGSPWKVHLTDPPGDVNDCGRSCRFAALLRNRGPPRGTSHSASAVTNAPQIERKRWPICREKSGRTDLNRGPHRPERCALPGCATPRIRPLSHRWSLSRRSGLRGDGRGVARLSRAAAV